MFSNKTVRLLHDVLPIPMGPMYGIFTCIWVIYRANVSKYSIHGACGIDSGAFLLEADILAACERFRSAAENDEALLVRQSALLALAVAFLQHFVRANWTGPPEQADQRGLYGFMIISRPCPALGPELSPF